MDTGPLKDLVVRSEDLEDHYQRMLDYNVNPSWLFHVELTLEAQCLITKALKAKIADMENDQEATLLRDVGFDLMAIHDGYINIFVDRYLSDTK